jgi:hypothetical protein
VELGDAVSKNGEYIDAFDKKNFSLHPVKNILQPLTRRLNPFVN